MMVVKEAASNPLWWQTILSTAAGGGLAIFGQWLTARRQGQTQERMRQDARKEAVHDKRLDYELERLEELRQALLEAEEVASHGRRHKKHEVQGAFGVMSAERTIDTMINGPIDVEKAQRFGPAMLQLRASIAVTLDAEVRRLGQTAYDALRTGEQKPSKLVSDALDAIGRRLRTIQKQVDAL